MYFYLVGPNFTKKKEKKTLYTYMEIFRQKVCIWQIHVECQAKTQVKYTKAELSNGWVEI